MRLLVICQYYYPEPFRIADLCEELAKRGHEVTVVTGKPNYPEGKLYPGYQRKGHTEETLRGVRVHRCPIIPRKSGVLYRFLNYYSYVLSSKRFVKKCKASDGKPFDAVLVNQLSPVLMAKAAISYKKKNHVPILMYCLDLWPESLTAGGIRKGSALYRAFHRISGKIYRRMDRILVTSKMFEDYLMEEFSIGRERIGYLPQYAEKIFEQPFEKQTNAETLLTFAGNIGAAQSVDTIIAAAEKLKDEPIVFRIVGNGIELERLKKTARGKGLSRVIFLGRKPLKEMPGIYKESDAMLITLGADPVLSRTLPGKIQSYMAAGKPIIGAIDGAAAAVITEAECGYCGAAEDADKLAENILRFVANKDKDTFGRNAKAYYEANFVRERFMDRMEAELFKLIQD